MTRFVVGILVLKMVTSPFVRTGQIYSFYSSVLGGPSAAPFTRFLFMVRGPAACAALFYVPAYLLGSWGICQRLWKNTQAQMEFTGQLGSAT